MLYTLSSHPLQFNLDNFLWNSIKKVPSFAYLSYNERALKINFKVFENKPLTLCNEHMQKVCCDSCVEFFIAFDQKIATQEFSLKTAQNFYFNFEFNSKGCCYAKAGTIREQRVPLTTNDFDMLNINTQQDKQTWSLSFELPFSLVEHYLGFKALAVNQSFAFNLYKICENKDNLHFACFKNMSSPTPDFHKLEDFVFAKLG